MRTPAPSASSFRCRPNPKEPRRREMPDDSRHVPHRSARSRERPARCGPRRRDQTGSRGHGGRHARRRPTTRSAVQIAEQIEFIGGELTTHGGEDFTTATLRVLKKDADLGFTLLADILMNPKFDAKEVARVRDELV